jgi:hypothetical protein
MAPPIVYVDVSAIREGKHEELEAGMDNLSRYVEEPMPRVAFYGFFLDETQSTMTVVAVHPDSASLQFHLDEGNEEFRKFGHLLDLSRIDVYGEVSDGSRSGSTVRRRCWGAERSRCTSSGPASPAEPVEP